MTHWISFLRHQKYACSSDFMYVRQFPQFLCCETLKLCICLNYCGWNYNLQRTKRMSPGRLLENIRSCVSSELNDHLQTSPEYSKLKECSQKYYLPHSLQSYSNTVRKWFPVSPNSIVLLSHPVKQYVEKFSAYCKCTRTFKSEEVFSRKKIGEGKIPSSDQKDPTILNF